MKKALLFILILFAVSRAYSLGPLDIGLKFGTNTSSMITDIDDVLNQNINQEELNSYLAGLFLRLNVGRIYAQTEAYFNTKGGFISPVGDQQFQIPTATTFNYQTVDVPVLLGIKLIKRDLINLRLHTGPVYSYMTTPSLITDISNLDPDDINDHYIGWQFGAGIDIWFLNFDARIENSANILAPESPYHAKNRSYLLTVGIKLF